MIDLFLKAPDQASLYAALESAGLMLTDHRQVGWAQPGGPVVAEQPRLRQQTDAEIIASPNWFAWYADELEGAEEWRDMLGASDADKLSYLRAHGFESPWLDDESYEPVYEDRRIPSQASHGHALDVIGDLWVDEDGNPAGWFKPGVTKLPGCHANLRLWGANAATIEMALASVIIAEPNRAQRVWA
jgi:hypothetical protein